MLIKAVLVFLLVMVVIAMLGNAMFPGAIGRGVRRRIGAVRPGVCKDCGKPRIGSSACGCGGK